MVDFRKLSIVARFELLEAFRSRLILVILGMYGAGAALGSYIFVKVLAAAEEAARSGLARASGIPESQVPKDLVREHALPWVSSLVEDDAIREQLVQMPPLSIFYGYMALSLVALLVLVVSAGTMAADLASGASRFTLFRCDRLTWALGKLAGQELLLGAGLLFGAVIAGSVGLLVDSRFEMLSFAWLFRTSFRAWVYGSAYMGIFLGLSLLARSALGARAMALFSLILFAIAHAILTADFANARLPFLRYLGLIFPADHREALWSPEWGAYLPAVFALFAIGAAGFAGGHLVFKGRDA